jgi:hypothetical protein
MPPGLVHFLKANGRKEKIFVEDRDSEVAKGWIGTTESYNFTEQNGVTTLTIELTINPEWEKMFSDSWPKALAKLKEVCER